MLYLVHRLIKRRWPHDEIDFTWGDTVDFLLAKFHRLPDYDEFSRD